MARLRKFQENETCERSGLYVGITTDGKLVGAAQRVERDKAFGPPPDGAKAWVLYRADPAWMTRNSIFLAISIVIAVGSFFLFWIPDWNSKVLVVWAADFVAVALLLVNFSHAITGRVSGWLINTQLRMSLSRLQMFLWMTVVMSAFLTAVLANVYTGAKADALAIKVPELLWLAMGVSTTSLVGSGLILDNKKKKDPKDEEVVKLVVSKGAELPLEDSRITEDEINAASTAAAEKKRKQRAAGAPISDSDITAASAAAANKLRKKRARAKRDIADEVQKARDKDLNGVLVTNETIAHASPADFLTGEEAGNYGVLEPTRFFNLIVTLIVVGVYAVNLGATLVSTAFSKGGVEAFPPLGAASATMLSLSHAAYLADKFPDKEETTP